MLWPSALLAVSIELTSGIAEPGGTGQISGILREQGADVSGVELQLTATRGISVGVNARGRPACVSHCTQDYQPIVPLAEASTAGIDPVGEPAKSCTRPVDSAAFLPVGCSPGVNCTGVKYLELGLSNVLPDGGTLFTCTITVAADLAAGTYAVGCSGAGASDPEGQTLPATCSDGALHVSCPGDCDGNGRVNVHEVLLGLTIMEGAAATADCSALDTDADDAVGIAELVTAYRRLVNGCGTE
jgi:hypothetical protein